MPVVISGGPPGGGSARIYRSSGLILLSLRHDCSADDSFEKNSSGADNKTGLKSYDGAGVAVGVGSETSGGATPAPGPAVDGAVSNPQALPALTRSSGSPKLASCMASATSAGPPNSSKRQFAVSLSSECKPSLGAWLSHSSSFMQTTETFNATIPSASELIGASPASAGASSWRRSSGTSPSSMHIEVSALNGSLSPTSDVRKSLRMVWSCRQPMMVAVVPGEPPGERPVICVISRWPISLSMRQVCSTGDSWDRKSCRSSTLSGAIGRARLESCPSGFGVGVCVTAAATVAVGVASGGRGGVACGVGIGVVD